MTLILFDIDGTLLLSSGAGARSMEAAGRRLHGGTFSFDGVDFAGRLDPLIWLAAAAANGVEDPAGCHDVFRRHYSEILSGMLASADMAAALPGVMALLDALETRDDVALGLLTGNYPETGAMKLEAAGIAPDRFSVAAWGSDGPERRALPPVAFTRYADQFGQPIAPEDVVIIGDTPHDVDCAKHNGCRSIGVATGPGYTAAQLAEAGPDLLVDDLTGTDLLLQFLTAT